MTPVAPGPGPRLDPDLAESYRILRSRLDLSGLRNVSAKGGPAVAAAAFDALFMIASGQEAPDE